MINHAHDIDWPFTAYDDDLDDPYHEHSHTTQADAC